MFTYKFCEYDDFILCYNNRNILGKSRNKSNKKNKDLHFYLGSYPFNLCSETDFLGLIGVESIDSTNRKSDWKKKHKRELQYKKSETP
jgi:hypothetical protein